MKHEASLSTATNAHDHKISIKCAALGRSRNIIDCIAIPLLGEALRGNGSTYGVEHFHGTPAANFRVSARQAHLYMDHFYSVGWQAFHEHLHHKTLAVQGRRSLCKYKKLHRRR
jgi:hypothetical protein